MTRVLLCAVAILATSCIGDEGATGVPKCVPGTSAPCVCADARPGAQLCTTAGVFGPCSCGISTDGGNHDASSSDTGLGGTRLTASPSVVDFGLVGFEESATLNVTLTNTGTNNLEVQSFSLTGETSFKLLMTGQSFDAQQTKVVVPLSEPLRLGPGSSSVVKVQFAPNGPEVAKAQLAFFTNDPDEASGVGPVVSLRANTSAPCLHVTPPKAEFGGKLIGKQATIDIELINCGDVPVTITELRLLAASEKPDVTVSTDFALELDNLKNAPPGTTSLTDSDDALVLNANEAAAFTVTFTPDSENPVVDGVPTYDLGFVKLVANTFVPGREVGVTGFGIHKGCPTGIIKVQEGQEVIPQTKLHLFGSQSFAGSGAISKHEWTVVAPPGSVSVFLPNAVAPDPTFEVNVAGTYLFKLEVWDENGNTSCLVTEYQVLVIPDEAIHVELLWTTPEDPDESDTGSEAGSNLDLHFAHPLGVGVGVNDADGDGQMEPWFHSFRDCYWFNVAPNWGAFDPTIADDPGLDRDDTDGAGPEIMNLNVPENELSYWVGVHYWNDHGFGLAEATIRVYIHSVLVFQVEGIELIENDLWEVATVAWPSGQVSPITGAGGGYKIIPNYPNPIFPQE